MPRNSSGTYTLPIGAFAPLGLIKSADHNSNYSDIAIALTQSLATTGVSTMTGPVKAAVGAVGAPGYAFGADATTGFYLPGAGQIGWAALGIQAATFNSDKSVTWAGGATWGGNVTFNGAVAFNVAVTFNSSFSMFGSSSGSSGLSVNSLGVLSITTQVGGGMFFNDGPSNGAMATMANAAGGPSINRLTLTSTATNVPPSLSASGSDTDININLIGKGAGTVGFGNAGSFAANGGVATSLGSVGPVGSNTTVQKWLTIIDNGGVKRFIPCF
jgi:hypothetical protein